MPKGVPLSEKEKQQIYTRYVIGGERQRDIAEDFKISVAAVSAAIKQQRKLGEAEVHEKVIAGDKRNGRLVAGKSSNRFEGTCVIGGKSHSKSFTAANGHAATEQWEKWCQDLSDEAEFMAMVERKPKAEEESVEQPEEQPVKQPEPVPAPTADMMYVIWAKTAVPKLYGAYQTMETALRELDKLNGIAAYLGETKFEVEEVAWRG